MSVLVRCFASHRLIPRSCSVVNQSISLSLATFPRSFVKLVSSHHSFTTNQSRYISSEASAQSVVADASVEQSATQSINPSLIHSADQSVPSDVPSVFQYQAKRNWVCRKCGNRVKWAVTCSCGEINTLLRDKNRERARAYRSTPRSQAMSLVNSRASDARRIQALNDIRRMLTKRSNNNGTCEWNGCAVPFSFLDLVHTDPSRKTQRPANMNLKEIRSLIEHNTNTDGNILLLAVCPVHHAELVHRSKSQSGNEAAIETTSSTTKPTAARAKRYTVQAKIETKVAMKSCDHDRCFHPDIPQCTHDNHHLFVLSHIIDVKVAKAFNLEAPARSVNRITVVANTLALDSLTREIEKCRLMHATCHRDAMFRFRALNLDEKKAWIRNYLSTHNVAEWFRQSITRSLDQHDAMQLEVGSEPLD